MTRFALVFPGTPNNSPRKRGVTRYALVDPNPQGACRPLSLRRFAPGRTRTPWDNLRFPPLCGSPFPCAFGAVYRKRNLRRNGTVNRLNDGQPYAHSCNSRHVDATARIPAEMRNSDKPEPSEFMGENTNRLGQKTLRQRPESLIQQGFPVKCRQIVASLPLAAYAGSSCFHP